MPLAIRALVLLLALSAAAIAGAARGEPDRRSFVRVTHRSTSPREVSVYLDLAGGEDPGGSAPVHLWSDLSLRLLPLRHVEVREGVFAYAVQLLSDEAGDRAILPIDQPAHGITADVVAAFHFRNRDNSGPNSPGPLNVNAPGELRVVRYPSLSLEIRVLSFEIVEAEPGAVPAFGALRLLVTAREDAARQGAGGTRP